MPPKTVDISKIYSSSDKKLCWVVLHVNVLKIFPEKFKVIKKWK